MRKVIIAFSVAAGFGIAASVPQLANAMPIGSPNGMTAAAEELNGLESVHCRPGWRHHVPTSWRRADGCRRRGAVIITPGTYRSYGFHRGHRVHRSYRHR